MSHHFQTSSAVASPVTARSAIDFEAFFSDSDGALETGEDEIDLTAEQTFLVFVLGGQRFAMAVSPVREILDPCDLTPLPNAPAIVKGMIDLRGEAVVVFDVSTQLGVTAQGWETQRIIVFEAEGTSQKPIGMLADTVLRVAEIPPAEMEPPPSLDGVDPMRILRGIARLDGHMTLVLEQAGLLLAHSVDLSSLQTD